MNSTEKINSSLNAVPKLINLILLFLLLFFCWEIYQLGTTGPLLLDGYANLIPMGSGVLQNFDSFLNYVFGNNAGPGGRPVAMLSFCWMVKAGR